MRKGLALPVAGVLLALAITAVMDATGLTVFSALPLAPLLAIFWYARRPFAARRRVRPRAGPGLRPAPSLIRSSSWVSSPPVAAAAGALDPSRADWAKALANIGLVAFSTLLAVMITGRAASSEAGCWGALERRGYGPTAVLSRDKPRLRRARHISPIVLPTGCRTFPPRRSRCSSPTRALLGAMLGRAALCNPAR